MTLNDVGEDEPEDGGEKRPWEVGGPSDIEDEGGVAGEEVRGSQAYTLGPKLSDGNLREWRNIALVASL